MTALRMPESHQSPLGAVLSGCWKLQPELAITLLPEAPGVLRVAQGRIWVTLQGPHQGPANDWGDVVLARGEQLRLDAGEQLVVESYGEAVNAPAWFSWVPAVPAVGPVAGVAGTSARAASRERTYTVGWLHYAGRAYMGLGTVLSWLVPGRGAVLPPLERNQP